MEMDEQMANQPDNHGIVVSTTVADAPAPQNGAVVDSPAMAPAAIAATVDGAALGSAIHTYLASIQSLEGLSLAAKIERASSILTTFAPAL